MKAHAIRIASVILLAAATMVVSAAGDPAVACAAPREWDIGQFDRCMERAERLFVAGDITYEQWGDQERWCCDASGGQQGPEGCEAPPGVQDTPTSAPPTKPTAGPPPPKLPSAPAPFAPVG